jgi:hypothetical protein
MIEDGGVIFSVECRPAGLRRLCRGSAIRTRGDCPGGRAARRRGLSSPGQAVSRPRAFALSLGADVRRFPGRSVSTLPRRKRRDASQDGNSFKMSDAKENFPDDCLNQ